MNAQELAEQYAEMVNGRLEQLNSIIRVVLSNMRNEMSDEVALREIQGILTQENR